MSYNTKIVREQGGSVLAVNAGGSVNYAAGARQDWQSGVIRLNGGPGIYFGTATPLNAISASPGSVYIRSDGANSGIWINTSSGVAGQTWVSASGVYE